MDLTQVFQAAAHLNKHTDADWQTLSEVSDKLKPWGPAVAKDFYDTLYDYEPTAEVLNAYERSGREKSLIGWYEAVISGEPGRDFWTDQWVVGLIHIVISVKNTFMLGMTSRVSALFLEQCVKTFERDEALKIYGAFRRIMDTVGVIIAEGYLHGLQAGMEQVGVNDALMQRMRQIAVKKMIGKFKGTKWSPSPEKPNHDRGGKRKLH